MIDWKKAGNDSYSAMFSAQKLDFTVDDILKQKNIWWRYINRSNAFSTPNACTFVDKKKSWPRLLLFMIFALIRQVNFSVKLEMHWENGRNGRFHHCDSSLAAFEIELGLIPDLDINCTQRRGITHAHWTLLRSALLCSALHTMRSETKSAIIKLFSFFMIIHSELPRDPNKKWS